MAKGYLHLTGDERCLIQAQLSLRQSPAVIAAGLCRSRSTVTREIARNGWAVGAGGKRVSGVYTAARAQFRARLRAAKLRVPRKLQLHTPLWELVLKHLRRGLSPEQIAGTLAHMQSPVRISYEAIYTALYAMPRGELRESTLKLLRRGHKGRRLRASAHDRRNKAIPDMVLIDQRPEEVDQRLVPGHWEGDLLIGKGNRSQVGTLVERSTLFVALVRLDDAKAPTVASAFATILNRVDSQLRRSMTYDQGTEMAHHKTLTGQTGVAVYFAHPHSPWERGISENTNGLLRQYLPKSTDLSVFTQHQLDDFAWLLNTRPRKTLAWKTPAELFLPPGAFDFVKHWAAEDTVALGP
ncbi:MAG: IS30 family transposase [Acidobacteriota bacterium]|nr:IS30 family transposase [Acidobacteriota bacterium]